MHSGKRYTLKEFLIWTRRDIYKLFLIAVIPTLVYKCFDIKFIAIPWVPIALIGTAAAFIVGFKNTQTYNRLWEARQIYGAIINSSRSLGMIVRDFIYVDKNIHQEIFNRHFAWLTALRYEMRSHRVWETTQKKHNAEFQRHYRIPEKLSPLRQELEKYLDQQELELVLKSANQATQVMGLQSKALKAYCDQERFGPLQFMEMERGLKEFLVQQGQSEQVKNAPYPRQYAIINTFFVRLFCLLLPFGMLKEFEKLNDITDGMMKGYMVWLVVPFSILISWMYTSLEQVGESTENPFEGSANDVPISHICRTIEIELKELLGHQVPATHQAKEHIIL